jgi:hypothetical protein
MRKIEGGLYQSGSLGDVKKKNGVLFLISLIIVTLIVSSAR